MVPYDLAQEAVSSFDPIEWADSEPLASLKKDAPLEPGDDPDDGRSVCAPYQTWRQ